MATGNAAQSRTHRARLIALIACALGSLPAVAAPAPPQAPQVIERHDGFVNTGEVLIYYESIGHAGTPLVILHGGPGSTHDYFLPHLLPLSRSHRLVLIDERGSGRSQRPSDPKQYTLNAMAADVEAVRIALKLGKVDLLGHSFGGILAQAVAVQYPDGIRRLILASTGSSAARINADFKQIKDSLDEKLRVRIEQLEAQGILGPDGAQLPEYRRLADQAEAPYSYFVRPPPWDSAGAPMGWDALNVLWGAKSDFHIDGNLVGFDFTAGLHKLHMPALVIYGDHDLVSPATARQSHEALAGSELIEMPRAAHMTFVDQNAAFIDAVSRFLKE